MLERPVEAHSSKWTQSSPYWDTRDAPPGLFHRRRKVQPSSSSSRNPVACPQRSRTYIYIYIIYHPWKLQWSLHRCNGEIHWKLGDPWDSATQVRFSVFPEIKGELRSRHSFWVTNFVSIVVSYMFAIFGIDFDSDYVLFIFQSCNYSYMCQAFSYIACGSFVLISEIGKVPLEDTP